MNGDFVAFENILHEGLQRYQTELFSYVERNALRAERVNRAEDWRWGSLWRWLQKPEPDPKLLSPWPIARLPKWVGRVTEKELAAVRVSAQRGRPLGDVEWVGWIARRLGLESTIRPRGRQRIHS